MSISGTTHLNQLQLGYIRSTLYPLRKSESQDRNSILHILLGGFFIGWLVGIRIVWIVCECFDDVFRFGKVFGFEDGEDGLRGREESGKD